MQQRAPGLLKLIKLTCFPYVVPQTPIAFATSRKSGFFKSVYTGAKPAAFCFVTLHLNGVCVTLRAHGRFERKHSSAQQLNACATIHGAL